MGPHLHVVSDQSCQLRSAGMGIVAIMLPIVVSGGISEGGGESEEGEKGGGEDGWNRRRDNEFIAKGERAGRK